MQANGLPNVSPGKTLFGLTVLSSPFQFFLFSIASIYPPITLLAALALALRFRVLNLGRIARPLLWIYCLAGIRALSIAWSPDPYFGVREVVYMAPYLFIFAASYYQTIKNPRFVYAVIVSLLFITLFESVLVIYFRFSPTAKLAFLEGPLGNIFVSANILSSDFRNNVLDPAKSGGMLPNANAAGCWVGMAAFISLTFGIALRRKWLILTGVFHMTAVFFTGSKAAVIFAVSLTVLLVVLSVLQKRVTAARVSGIMVMCLAILAGYFVVLGFLSGSDFAQTTSSTFDVRAIIWAHAAAVFMQSPFLGEGFGGWAISFQPYVNLTGLSEVFPPHNTIIYLWSQSGIVAAALGITFIVSFIRDLWSIFRAGQRDLAVCALGVMAAYAWMFGQGMGENWGLLGDLHMMTLAACSYGFVKALMHLTLAGQADLRREADVNRDGRPQEIGA